MNLGEMEESVYEVRMSVITEDGTTETRNC